MTDLLKKFIGEYQCTGCSSGCSPDDGCFKKSPIHDGCDAHYAGTIVWGLGSIYLGMPKGFNRIGDTKNGAVSCDLFIYETDTTQLQQKKFNIPFWKYRTPVGHTMVRFYSPRVNRAHIEVFLFDCLDLINCLELSDADISAMD